MAAAVERYAEGENAVFLPRCQLRLEVKSSKFYYNEDARQRTSDFERSRSDRARTFARSQSYKLKQKL